MKKLFILLMVLTFLLAGCQSTTSTPVPDNNVHTNEVKQIEQPKESEQIKTTITPSLNTPTPTRESSITEEVAPTATQGVLIPITSTEDFSTILYYWHGFLIVGGSLNGQWLEPLQFEAKLDGEITDPCLVEDSNEVDLEFALLKKDQSIDLYNNDGYFGNCKCESLTYVMDCYANLIYSVNSDNNIEIDNPTIGIKASWDPYPLLERCGEFSEDEYLIDINNDGNLERLLVSKHKKDEEITVNTLILEMGDKEIPISEIWVDDTYCYRYNIFFLDLNGDGQIEIITAEEGHNLYVAIYDIVDGEAQTALSLYIGD